MKNLVIIVVVIGLAYFLYRKYKKPNNQLGKLKRPPKVRIVYSKKFKPSDRPKISSSEDAEEVLREIWSAQIDFREEFIVLLMDRSNRVLGYQLISKGGITGTVVDIRLILAAAIKSLASGIIIAHNHPSGNLKPSQPDINMTKKVKQAGNTMDVQVLDHLILTKEGYYSFADEGIV